MTHTVPPVWFRLPPGFHDIGPGARDAVDEIAGALGGAAARGQLAALMDCLDGLARQPGQHLVHTSVGLHPDGRGALSTSLFSLSVRPTAQAGPRAGVARAALALADSALPGSSTRRFVELPSALPCALVAGVVPVPGGGREVFQARAVTAHPEGRHLLFLDLASAATEHAEAYADILEAVAHTIGFRDPSARPTGAGGTSRILELLG